MQARGAALPPGGWPRVDSLLALVELENGAAAPSYVAGDEQLLRGDAIQLVELLRDGGGRSWGGGACAEWRLGAAATN